MRKLFISILAALPLLSASAEVTFEYDESTKTLTFSGEGKMDVYTTDMFGDTYIDPAWSELKTDVEKVVINEGVEDVGEQAFMGFTVLKEITLPTTVKSVGPAAFEGCVALAGIKLPEGLEEIGEEAFYNCKAITSVSIPKNITKLSNHAFRGCESLKTIDLGNVKEFGNNVFAYCGFETFSIPEGTKVIPQDMFFACKNMRTFDIPACVEKIEDGAFYYCELDTVNFLGENFPKITGFNNFSLTSDFTVYRINCQAYSKEAVEAIKNHGGAYDTKIIPAWPQGTDIYSTNNAYGPLTITPVDCDKNLYKLSIELWSSYYQVTWGGTYNVPTENLHSPEIVVDLTEPTTIIADIEYNPNGGESIPSITLSVTWTGMGNVTMTTLEETKTSSTYKLVATPKEGYEFLYWESYNEGVLTEEQKKSPEIEFTITQAEELQAFFTQSPFCGINEGENVRWAIQNDTLYLTGEGEMENYNFWVVAPFAFSLNDFHYVHIGEGITSIGEMTFFFMENIKEAYLPSTLTKMGKYNLTGCEALEKVYFAGTTPPSIDLPNDMYIKEESTEKTQVVVPCEALDAYKELFAEAEAEIICEKEIPSIDDFTFDPANVCGAEGDGSNILWSYDEDTQTLALKGTGKMANYSSRKKGPWNDLTVKNLIISEGVTNIGDYAFHAESALEHIELPTTIDTINYHAFSSTASLKELTLPEGLKLIESEAFSSSGATRITLPSTLEKIDGYAFQYSNIKSIVIPASVTEIGQGAFYGSNNLEEIVFESETPANTGGYTFVTTATTAIGSPIKLIVPCDAVETYKATKGYQPQYIQGVYPYTLKFQEITNEHVGSNLGGRVMIQQWPDCKTGEAIVYAYVKDAYVFSHWETEGVTLTEEQAKSETITFTVDADCTLSAVFVDKQSVNVADIDADNIVVTCSEARISVNRDVFRIYDTLGRDVTIANGHLTSGIYIVECEGKSIKTVLR